MVLCATFKMYDNGTLPMVMCATFPMLGGSNSGNIIPLVWYMSHIVLDLIWQIMHFCKGIFAMFKGIYSVY